MSTLALVYLEATNHIVSSALVKSGYASIPKVEDLVGPGPLIRDPATLAFAVNVARTALTLKVLALDTATFDGDRATLDGLLGNPQGHFLQLKVPDDRQSPLVPTRAQSGAGISLTPSPPGTGNNNRVRLPSAPSRALQLLVVVQRGPVETSPIVAAANSIAVNNQPRSLQVDLQHRDWVWVLVESFEPVLVRVA